jgi:uncharacterized Zn finger protein (UPF0148 family)
MSTFTIDTTVTLTYEVCAACGVTFGAPDHLIRRRREDGGTFYCPNGHSLAFGKSENDRLKRDLAQAQRRQALAEGRETHQRDQRQAAERSNAALRGVVTRTKKRAAAGVCQCCSRTFQDVARHMASQHPAFTAGALEAGK